MNSKNCLLCKNKTDLNNLTSIDDNYLSEGNDVYISYCEIIRETLDIEVIQKLIKINKKNRQQKLFLAQIKLSWHMQTL
jgi:hypothetical protein